MRLMIYEIPFEYTGILVSSNTSLVFHIPYHVTGGTTRNATACPPSAITTVSIEPTSRPLTSHFLCLDTQYINRCRVIDSAARSNYQNFSQDVPRSFAQTCRSPVARAIASRADVVIQITPYQSHDPFASNSLSSHTANAALFPATRRIQSHQELLPSFMKHPTVNAK